MIPDLILRWRACPLDAPPYVLPGDEALLESERWVDSSSSFDEFIHSPAFGASSDRLHVNLLPIPFLGDLRGASVYLLLLNSGFGPGNYYAEEHSSDYRDVLIRNLRQESSGDPYPFFFLNPRLSWHAGFTYWHGRLGGIAKQLSEQRKLSYQDALSELARSTCALELVPYQSSFFRLRPELVNQLTSVRLIREFVHEIVVEKAKKDEALVIVARGATQWKLPSHKNIVVYEGAATRGAYFGAQTSGGREITRRLGLS